MAIGMAIGMTSALQSTATLETRGKLWRWWHSLDQVMLVMLLFLALIGLFVHFSISPIAAKKFSLAPYYLAFKHSIILTIAIVLMLGISVLNHANLVRLALFMMLAALLLMIAILFYGTPYLGARRWLDLGLFTLQPSEFLKPSFAILSAALLAQYAQHERNRIWWLATFALYLLVALLLLLQPDVGQLMLITLGLLATWFVVGMSPTVMLIWILTLSIGSLALYRLLPHVADRIHGFMQFSSDLGEAQSGQVYIGLNLLHEGGLFGKELGIGEAAQRLFDPRSDSIFVVIGEQMGILFAVLVLGIYVVFTFSVLNRIRRLKRHFPFLAGVGLIMQITTQAWVNMGSNLGMIPPKGTTLPWISAGGSAIIATAIACGCLLSITRNYPNAQ